MMSILVAGTGVVGGLTAELLADSRLDVSTADVRPDPVAPDIPHRQLDFADGPAIEQALDGMDAVVSCLPFQLNATLARAARRRGTHYFDLTEDRATTQGIQALESDLAPLLVPQCGLAPGLICILGASLASRSDELESLQLRVGALPQVARGSLGYAVTWSPAGLVNEYVRDCEVIAAGERKLVPPLSDLEAVVVDGVALEAFTTSGGLGTLCDTLEGRVRHLDYKSLRYPGHCHHVRFLLRELRLADRFDEACRILQEACPPTDDDVVFLHAVAETRRDGVIERRDAVGVYRPRELLGRPRRAIAWTTAASVCGVVELAAAGRLPVRGFVRQEDIPLDALLSTRSGSLLAGALSRTGEAASTGPERPDGTAQD
jgi:saccharopine dehydrogenase-like NADP-dependent oxidoreductase